MGTKRLKEITTAAGITGTENLVAISDPAGSGQEVLIPLSNLLTLIRLPPDANFRFKEAGTLQILNTTTGEFHSLWLANDANGKPVLQWSENGEV